jgi:hypothetical protein
MRAVICHPYGAIHCRIPEQLSHKSPAFTRREPGLRLPVGGG